MVFVSYILSQLQPTKEPPQKSSNQIYLNIGKPRPSANYLLVFLKCFSLDKRNFIYSTETIAKISEIICTLLCILQTHLQRTYPKMWIFVNFLKMWIVANFLKMWILGNFSIWIFKFAWVADSPPVRLVGDSGLVTKMSGSNFQSNGSKMDHRKCSKAFM